MNILTIAPTPFFADRGTHIRILEEARAQARGGATVTIVTYHIGKTPSLPEGVTVRRIHRWLFWYKKLEAGPDWQKIILDLLLLRKVLVLAYRTRPEVLHAHLHEGVLIAWVVQKILWFRKMTLVADMHGSLVNEMASHGYLSFRWIQWIFGALERWINNLGDIMVSSSWENKTVLERTRRDTVAVLPDGVNMQAFADAAIARSVMRERYGIAAETPVVIYAGAMIPNKGIDYLLDALPNIHTQCPSAVVVFAGAPRDYVEREIAKRGAGDYTRIITPLPYDQLPQVLAIADCAVDPKDDGVNQASGKILQYMGAALPIVCFDRHNNRRYIGDDAFYAKEVTAKALGAAIVTALHDISRRKEISLVMHQRAQAFTWDASAQIFFRLVAQHRKCGTMVMTAAE